MTHAPRGDRADPVGTAVSNPSRATSPSPRARATLASLHPAACPRPGPRRQRRAHARAQAGADRGCASRPADPRADRRSEVDLNGTAVRIRWADGDRCRSDGRDRAAEPAARRRARRHRDALGRRQPGLGPVGDRAGARGRRGGRPRPGRDRDLALCAMWVSDDLEEARAESRWAPAAWRTTSAT